MARWISGRAEETSTTRCSSLSYLSSRSGLSPENWKTARTALMGLSLRSCPCGLLGTVDDDRCGGGAHQGHGEVLEKGLVDRFEGLLYRRSLHLHPGAADRGVLVHEHAVRPVVPPQHESKPAGAVLVLE